MSGFSKDAAAFLADLASNNNRDWFLDNKKRYESEVKTPAKLFSADMAEALEGLTGHNYKSKTFRINRDLRFSKDKTPYNAHVRMSWTPDVDVATPPAFMISLEPTELIIGAGVFGLSGKALDGWRERVDSDAGAELAKTLKSLEVKGVRLSKPDLKRVPKPYATDHTRGDLLRMKGLNVWLDGNDMGEVTVEACLTQFKRLRPVFDWLAA